jgi:hypothetical protein
MSSRDRRGLWRLLSVGALLVIATVSTACASGGSPPRSPGASPSAANDQALSAAADKIGPVLEQRFPDSFAGLELDHPRHVMTIYRRHDDRLDAMARSTIPSTRVVFRDARFSLRQLLQLTDQVTADRNYWLGRGIDIQTTGPNTDGSGVRIGTARGAADGPALAQRYGADRVTVEQETVAPDGA